MSTIIYTMKRDLQGDLTALILTPDSNKKTVELAYFRTPQELQEAVKARYGDNAICVPSRMFDEELEKCTVHTPEMLEMLKENPEGDLSGHFVYGSPMRPMSSVWARVASDAIYIPSDRQKTGFHTYVAVLAKLGKEIIEKYDLIFISHGGNTF
jgi:hypothetical protein